MQVDIQSQGFTLTARLSEYVMKRLAYGVSHGEGAIGRVIVRLSDINGPRGGADKRCLIELRLKNAPPVVVEDIEADLYVAIDRAVERVGRALGRTLARRREYARGVPDRMADPAWDAPLDPQPEVPGS